jgi:hypothetical protein
MGTNSQSDVVSFSAGGVWPVGRPSAIRGRGRKTKVWGAVAKANGRRIPLRWYIPRVEVYVLDQVEMVFHL